MIPWQIYCDYLEDRGVDCRLFRSVEPTTFTSSTCHELAAYPSRGDGFGYGYGYDTIDGGGGYYLPAMGFGYGYGTRYGDGQGVGFFEDEVDGGEIL